MGFDKVLMTGMMLIELQKAFDMIDHDRLLKKLNAIGFSNHTIGWFKSYLSNQLFNWVNLENVLRSLHNYVWGTTRVHSETFTVSHVGE